MGFVKAQREQIQVPEVTDGAFIPAAAKSNALMGIASGAGEGAEGGAGAGADDVLIAGVSQVSHFNAELGFDKAQREQIHVPGLLEGAFIPAAAKSNALIAGTVGGTGEGAGGAAGAGAGADDVLIAGVSQVSHFNAELGFDKAQREQIHVPGSLEGAFIPAAAKSNPLTTGNSTWCCFITVASRTGGVGLLYTPKRPDDCGLLLLPMIIGGLLLGPKVNGLGFGLAGSNPKEKAEADLEGPDESSKFGSDETGRRLTRLCILATTELGKTEVALDVMINAGRELAVIVRAFALMSSTLVPLTFTFFACSCGFGDPAGETSVGLNEKLKLEEGGSNLKSDFGRPGGEGTGGTAGLGVDGAEVPSGWKLNLSLLGSLGTELNLLRDAVGLTFVGLVELLEGDDSSSMIGMINVGCSFVFSLCSAASISMSSNMSIVISGSGATIWVLSAAVGEGLRPLRESLVRFADRRASSASSSSTSSTTYVILLVSTSGASHCRCGLS